MPSAITAIMLVEMLSVDAGEAHDAEQHDDRARRSAPATARRRGTRGRAADMTEQQDDELLRQARQPGRAPASSAERFEQHHAAGRVHRDAARQVLAAYVCDAVHQPPDLGRAGEPRAHDDVGAASSRALTTGAEVGRIGEQQQLIDVALACPAARPAPRGSSARAHHRDVVGEREAGVDAGLLGDEAAADRASPPMRLELRASLPGPSASMRDVDRLRAAEACGDARRCRAARRSRCRRTER